MNRQQFCELVRDNYEWELMSDHLDPEPAPRRTYVGVLLVTIASVIRWELTAAYCRRYGHDIEVESHISPDSASEHWHCRRCHDGGSHRYY